MRIRSYESVFLAAVCLVLAACDVNPPKTDLNPLKPDPSAASQLPPVKVADTLPQFATQENEVQIADGFDDVDPSWVIGALVNKKTGSVRSLDSYLKKDAKLNTTPMSEIAFKHFIENSVAANAAWLDFVKADINDKTRAEVTVIKTEKVTTNSASIDKKALLNELKGIPRNERADYGVIIGYLDFIVSASYFRDSGANGQISGYGAKIGSNWYSKYEDSTAHHRIVAIWSPLPFVLDAVKSPKSTDLVKATSEAIRTGKLNIQQLQQTSLRIVK